MRRVSSKATVYYKRVFPTLFFGILFLVTLGPELMAMLAGPRAAQPAPLPFLIFPAAMAAFTYFIMKRLVFDLVDEVWDDGNSLIVRNAGKEERIHSQRSGT